MKRQRFAITVLFALAISYSASGQESASNSTNLRDAKLDEFVRAHCLECHSNGSEEGAFTFDLLINSATADHFEQWERVVRKLNTRQMPPQGSARPSESEYVGAINGLTSEIDSSAANHPNPGRTETFRRLTQTEYRNAIRDLLSLNVDVSELLPADESSHGFDNITVTGLSPVLLERYVSAAQKIARLAVGYRTEPAAEKTYRIAPDVTQDVHLEGTPLGTRGGTVVEYNFPQEGEYEIQAWLMRDRNEELEGMRGKHQLEMLVDRAQVAEFTIEAPPRGTSDKVVDANLKTSTHVGAGPHEVAVVFSKNPTSLLETVRQPLNVHFNYYRHPRIEPAIYQITIRGPFDGKPGGDTPSRKVIFSSYPQNEQDEQQCAQQIVRGLVERAYRRAATQSDIDAIMLFYRQGSTEGGFESGIERALSTVLVSPHFLFRIEREPEASAADTAYQLSPQEIASRLSFFLWNSIPDDELRAAAIDGSLQRPEVLEQQVKRMLADPRASDMIRNFAGQWLYLRNLDSVIPDMRLFPDFDDNLRQALRTETEMFFDSIVREDRSVMDLIKSDYTYLNERLAKHYEIDHVYGSHFRRVSLSDTSHRGGLLRHGSILTVTSYATRTSPVLRGHWVLKNIVGNPPPPPPPDVPALEDNTVAANLTVRQRLQQHRANEACAVCHNLLDPVGFSLENFDAVGRWRELENGEPIEATGGFPDGSEFIGVDGLEKSVLQRPELFTQTLTEKLMTFALGRGIEPYDMPAIRKIVHDAQDQDYRFSNIVLGIAKSVPFQMRKSQ